MIYIGIHRQRLSKNWANICSFVLSFWGKYRELTVIHFFRKVTLFFGEKLLILVYRKFTIIFPEGQNKTTNVSPIFR